MTVKHLIKEPLVLFAAVAALVFASYAWVANAAPVAEASTAAAPRAAAYLGLGVAHILLGVDHLLFVMGLVLVVRDPRRLVAAVTAFTVAHSVTLGLATLQVVRAPAAPIEAVIALSILFVAFEAARVRRGRAAMTARAPWVVASIFGLLHGFGFAGALSEIGLPHGDAALALVLFNAGVELGQLAFIAAVLGVLALVRRGVVAAPRWAGAAAPVAMGSFAAVLLLERLAAF
jgi:HupE / UreJ protein